MEKMAARTAMFLDIPGVVGMIDGRKMSSLYPEEFLEQNRDYNGWTKEVNRNVVLLWDPYRKIVDAVVNSPRNFMIRRVRCGGISTSILLLCLPGLLSCATLRSKLVET